MSDDFSFNGSDAANMPLDLSFSSQPLPEITPGTGQEQASADINLLNGSDVMETIPSPFPAPATPSETEFRPQLEDPESLHDQGSMMMYGAAEREERRRMDKQARLMDVLRAGAMDEEGRKKAAELWGQDTLNRLDLADEHDRAYMLGNRLMETIGDGDRDIGHQIYKNANNLWGTDVVTADQIWKDFQRRHQKTLDAYNENLKRIQTEQEEISRRMVDCVAGKEGAWDACPADLLKYAERPQEVADSIMRARRAYAFAERRGFEDVWRSDALDMADLLTVNVNGNEVLDQQALRLLMTAVDRKVQESQTDSIAFWRNLYGSFADTVRGVESMGVKAVQAVRNVPGMSGVEEWYSNNIAPLQGVKGTFDGQRQLFNRYEQRREALNTMQDVMHEFGQRMRGTSPDASWYVKAINGFGNITGQSLSYMAPGGWALAMAGDMGHAGNAASRNGDSLVDVTINGLRNTVEEKGFGVFSVFGRMGAINKLMTKTGTGALARLAAKVPGRTFFAGTRTGKMLSTPAFAYVEEMAAEPLAGEVFEWTARKLSGLVGAEVKPKDFEVVGPVLQAMGDVEQSGGCALFVAAMAAGHAPRMKQEVAAFVMDAQRSQLAGYTKKHAEEMASFSTMEHRAALAQRYFETDILKDPEGAAERAREAGAELAERQEARLYQMSGALDRVLERANIGSIRKLEGTDRYEVSLREGAEVNGVRLEEDRTMEMSEEQTDALVQVVLQGAYLNGVRVMQDAVLGNAAVSEAGKMDFIETLDMLSEEAPAEYRKAAAETGGMTVPGFMDVAARAQARIDAIVREEGVSVQEAGRRTDAEVMAKVQLGSIADLAAAFERRLDHAERSGEITRRRAGEIRSGTAAASSVHRFTMAADPGSSLLLYAGGHATTANVMEDVQESALVHYMNLTGKDWQDLWEHLQAADAVLGRYGMNLGTYEGPAKHAEDVVESFSNLSLSSSLADIENLPVPQWVKDTAEFALKNLEDSARIMRMGEQWNEFAATEEGRQFMKEHGGLADALQAVGVSTENVFRQARMDAAQKMDVEMVHADLASRRAPGDATLTLGELEALEESMARMDAAEDVEETAEDEEGAPPVAGNPASPAPLVEDADGALEGVGEEAEHDEEAGAEFRNHAFVRIAPDCVFAQVRVDALSLAPDVEQFKQGDHNERGAVKGRELQGRFREDAQPVSVWRRRDGALHVITGRHRFDLAVRDGVEFIPAYVYQEDEVHDATWAKMHDVGQNMLDGQASALEVAFFVRNSNMGRDEMEAQGYLRPGSANVMGWDIATLAGDEVFTRLKNGVITDHEAHRICRMSGTEAGQMLALQLREKGKPWDYVAAYVKEADRVAAEKSREGEAFDLFGNDTSWQEDCEKVARFTARGIAMIAERLSLLKKSRGISRRKDLAGRMGIRLETDADLNAAIRDLEAAKGAWQSHDPALRLHDRALAWDGTSEVNPFEHVPVSGATFSVVAMDSSGTVLGSDTFVTREDGSPDWFVIPRRKGQPDMPVRLLVGSDVGEHRGYGLTHILASRGFSFWKDRSPEHYISSILANVSELYEVAPGRELLVKGRQPSSWMLLQLDRKEGFYSIVSAYPVRQGKKPLGKKLPLAERQPANTNSGTARLGPGSASKAALPSQSAGGGDGFSLPQGARVVNVNEVECRFDDGSIVPATFSLSPEKEAIKKEAVAAGTFMKAPNGKGTNLTEDQWLSVRTEAFKSWFGDWEHDPQNASKVVDENGEPRVVYHGTYGDFTVFDKAKIGSATDYGLWGRGFYFTNMENTPYGNKKLALFLNIRNPFIFNDYKSAEEIGDYLNIWDGNFHEDDRFGIFRPYATGAAQIADSAQERGHDGLIAVLGKWTEYIAFEPNQIKSATDNRGTFDGENPDITFSIASAQEQGLFRDGHFEADNAVITEPGVTFSISALHASPHSFRKFDTAFMGKGEGAQAYGWGLYFAENPEVNRAYMDRFSQNKETLIRKIEAYSERKFYSVHSDLIYTLRQLSVLYPDKVLADGLRQYINTESVRVKRRREESGDDVPNYMAHILKREEEKLKDLQQILNWIHSGGELSAEMLSASNYRVALNVDDSVLLDWDRPVPENLRALMQSSPVEAVRELAGALSTNRDGTKYWTYQDYTGEAIYKKLMDDLFMDRPRSEAPDKNGRQKAASLALLDSGIKGIRYADGLSRREEGDEQTYNYVIFNEKYIKITAFADESTGGSWADYEDPMASFSLATRESIWVTLEREAQKNRLEVLRSQTAKALETWRRVCAANDVKQGDGAEAFGRVMAVVASIYKTLPEGYRFGLYPYMRAAENLATRLEDGQAWLSDELKKETLMDDTSERMDAVIDKLLARTLEQADRYAVDQMRAEMVARIKAVQPAKKASGKFNKGKLSAEDYRHLHGIVAMMNTDQEAKEKRMLELEGVLSSNQSTEEERDAAELELKDWHTFGHLDGMGLEQTRACMRALAQFITTGRTAWSARLDEERRRTKFKAEKIVEGLGQATPQGGRDAEEDAKASTRTKAAKYLKYGLQSYSQLLNGWKKIPALRGLAHAEVTAIAEANVALRNMKHARDREVTALVKRCFGVQRTKDVARVLSDFKKTGNSGVVLNPLVKVERTVRIAEAREWVGLSFEEREERRKAIRKEYHDRGLSDDKASVPEALIPEMRRQLAELDELVKAGDGRARRRKNITAKAEVVRPGRKGETLKVSRAQAMYAVLLYEQAEYVETMRNEGIGEAEVARLREFVGAEGLAFGYGLRELMNRQGKLLARVYEDREGVPFPAVENYFRAVFRADHKLDTKASFGEQTNAVAGGAKYGMLIPRRKHNLHLAWNMDCEAVFQAASAEVENYICTADITARWRGILADKEAAASLKEHMGRHGIDSLRHWLDVIDGAGVMEGGALLAGAQATSRFQSAKAVALLAWNVLTMLKQTSGLMHGMFAGEVGMGSFLLHLGQTMSMTGRMGVFEMMKTEAFRARTNDAQAEMVSQLMGYASDQNYNGAIRFSMAGMRAIEKMDVWSNAVSMTALYNAKWAELEEAGRRAGAPMTEDEMHALCMQSVTRALELVAQPLTQSQKSMLGTSTSLFAKMACFMSSEVLNKIGMIVSHVSAGNWGQALALYGVMSVAEQTVIALWHALLDDEDEWEKNGGWFGSMLGAPVAMIGGVPMLGAAVEFGYKQATGQRIYAGTASGVIDYSAIYRAAKNTWKAVTGEKEMTFADWAELILLDAKAAAYFAGAGAGSRSKAADSVASWLLSVAGVANLSKPGFSLAD
nr:MAG TPA: PolyVal ADP-Ribosyltransferase [Bacteriophage sp.]